MNIEQMKIVLKEILTNTDLTPCIVGHRGVGKTAGIIQVCRELERDYVPLRLGQMEVGAAGADGSRRPGRHSLPGSWADALVATQLVAGR